MLARNSSLLLAKPIYCRCQEKDYSINKMHQNTSLSSLLI